MLEVIDVCFERNSRRRGSRPTVGRPVYQYPLAANFSDLRGFEVCWRLSIMNMRTQQCTMVQCFQANPLYKP
jgi:hypothetical protein